MYILIKWFTDHDPIKTFRLSLISSLHHKDVLSTSFLLKNITEITRPYVTALELFIPELSYYQENMTTASLGIDSLQGRRSRWIWQGKHKITRRGNNTMSETALISNPLDYCPFMMIIEKKIPINYYTTMNII